MARTLSSRAEWLAGLKANDKVLVDDRVLLVDRTTPTLIVVLDKKYSRRYGQVVGKRSTWTFLHRLEEPNDEALRLVADRRAETRIASMRNQLVRGLSRAVVDALPVAELQAIHGRLFPRLTEDTDE